MQPVGHLQLVGSAASKEHMMLTSSVSALQLNSIMVVSNACKHCSPTGGGGVGDGGGDGAEPVMKPMENSK